MQDTKPHLEAREPEIATPALPREAAKRRRWPWVAALLRVREDRIGDAYAVRLIAQEDFGAAPGDAVTLRFVDKARNLHRGLFANAAMMEAQA